MRPNWVGPTSLVMKIAPSLRGLTQSIYRRQNYSDLCELGCDLTRDKLRSPWKWSAWRTRNWAKRIMTYIRLCQEKKTYSHMQHHVSTQRQKSSGPSQGCDNTIDSQSRRRSNIAGEIIIKEGRTRKVSCETLSHLNRREEERGGDFSEGPNLGLFGREIFWVKVQKEKEDKISSSSYD